MSGKKSSTESLTGKKSSDSVTDRKSSEEKSISKTKSKENIVPKSTELKKTKSSEKVGKAKSSELVKKTPSSENSGSKAMLRTKSNESIGKGRRSKSRENLTLEVKSTGKIGDLNIKTSKEDVNSKSPGSPNTEKGKDSRPPGEGYDTSGFSMAFGENSLRSRSASESESADGKVESKVESKDENDKGQQGRERRVAFRGVPPTMDEKMTRQSSNVLLNKFWPQRTDSTDSVSTQSNRQAIILSVAICFFAYALYKIVLFYFGGKNSKDK